MVPSPRPWREALALPGWLDVAGVLFFILGVPYTCALEVFVVLPTYHLPPLVVAANFALGAWITVQVLGHLVNVMRADTRPGLALTGPECERCHRPQPRATYHCPRCQHCVLERDHHCWLSGCCIGLANLRPFLIMLTIATFGGVYATAFNGRFYGAVLWPLGWAGGLRSVLWPLACLCAPHVLLVLGYISFFEFFVAANFSVGSTSTGLLCLLLVRQLMQLSTGQTNYEWRKDIVAPPERNAGSLRANLRRVFGDRPLWDLVWPSW